MFSQHDKEELRDYFNRLNTQLKRMPTEDRAELHQELRQHLDALVAAHEEQGTPPQEATEAAVRQFGDPVKMGRKLFQEWQISRSRGSRILILETFCASGLLLLLYVGGGNIGVPRNSIPDWVLTLLFCLCPPLIAGGVFGFFRPGAAIRNAALASLALSGIGIVLSLPDLSRDLAHIGSQLAYGIQNTASGIYWTGQWVDDAALAARSLAMTLFGVLPGVCTAYLISSWRRGGFYRIQAADFKLRARH